MKNNFTLLRLLFALFVIVTHSYPLSGTFTGDWLSRTTHAQFEFSFIGLSGFFIISGYLVYRSLERSKNIGSYFFKRAMRIYPALFCVLLISVFIGAIVSTISMSDYWTNSSTWTYLPKNMTIIKQQMQIDGVFVNNPYNPAINGSLWSLVYEVVFYFLLSLLFFCSRRTNFFILCLFVAILIVLSLFYKDEVSTIKLPIVDPRLVLEFGPFFFVGSLLATLTIEKLPYRSLFTVVLASVLVLAVYLNYFSYVKFFILPPLVLLIGLSALKPVVSTIERVGDMSYGIYLYGFPIQQTLMNYFAFDAIALMCISLPLSVVCGYVSWHLIEKRFLQFKSKLSPSFGG